MRIASLLLLLVFASCDDDGAAFEPWPIPIVGLDGGIDAGARDASRADASRADASADARTR